MNKQERENIGLNTGFFIVLSILTVAGFLIYFIPGNSISEAPVLNKVLAFIPFAGAAYFMYSCFKDNVYLHTNHIFDTILKIVIFVALVWLGFMILAVWHSGPIGVSTNPVK